MINQGVDMKGVKTTIAEGSHGQLFVTVPKQVASLFGVKKGNKVMWKFKNKKIVGELMVDMEKY